MKPHIEFTIEIAGCQLKAAGSNWYGAFHLESVYIENTDHDVTDLLGEAVLYAVEKEGQQLLDEELAEYCDYREEERREGLVA